MFDIDKFGLILPTALREATIRIARRRKLPEKIRAMMELNGLNTEMVNGFATYYSESDNSDIEIYFVYSEEEIEFAMMHDIVRNKHVFLVFPNYIIKDDNPGVVYNIMGRIIETLAFYSLPDRHDSETNHIKDVYSENIYRRLLLYAIYNVWKSIDKFCYNNENVKITGVSKEEIETAMIELDIELGAKI